MSIIRDNLINQKGYTPYCGNWECGRMPRSEFNGEQFKCPQCSWVSDFPKEFIKKYKDKWGLNN